MEAVYICRHLSIRAMNAHTNTSAESACFTRNIALPPSHTNKKGRWSKFSLPPCDRRLTRNQVLKTRFFYKCDALDVGLVRRGGGALRSRASLPSERPHLEEMMHLLAPAADPRRYPTPLRCMP